MTLHLGWRGPAHQARVAAEAPGGGGADVTPDPFGFPAVGAAALSTSYESAAAEITGVDPGVSVSVSGGEYSLNGGGWISTPTSANSGDLVRLRAASSSAVATTTQATLTVGEVSQAFEVTTVAHAEASALALRFAADPGSARRGLIDMCIGALKAAGVWPKLDVLHMYAAHDSQAARQNWVQDAFHATAVGGPIFTADRGYAGDGAAAYVDTNFNDLTGSSLWTQNSFCAGAYLNQDTVASNSFLGLASGAVSLRIGASSSNITTRVHSTTSFNPFFSNARPGHIAVARDTATTSRCLRNGVSVNTSGSTSTPSVDANVVAFRSNSSFNSDRMACLHLGGFLTPGEVAALYDAVLAYLTAIGGQ